MVDEGEAACHNARIGYHFTMKLRFASMTVGLTLGVTAAVVVACTVAAYFYSVHYFNRILEMARTNALAEGELIHTALEHAMLNNDRPQIAQMIEGFGNQARVEQLVLLDRNGVPRYSSSPLNQGEDFRISSPTCQACHRDPPERRGSSRVIETRGGAILRTVVPIRNREECYRCHDAAQKINGVLILDYDAGEVRASMTRDLGWMVAGTGALTFIIVGAIFVVIRVSVLRRLQRLEMTARLVSQGDLKRRAPVEGSDTLAWLGREFNVMADSVAGLVGEVNAQRERLETVINSIDDGIVVLDPDRKIIAANDAFLRRIGGSRDQVLGHCCYQLEQGSCNLTDCPTLEYLRSGYASGENLRTSNRQWRASLGRRFTYRRSWMRNGRLTHCSGGVARHLGAAGCGGQLGRVPSPCLTGRISLRLFARVEHSASHRAYLHRRHPSRDSHTAREAGGSGQDSRECLDCARAVAALSRYHPAFPAIVAGTGP